MIGRKVIFERHYPSVDEELDEAALAEIDNRCETVKEMSSDDIIDRLTRDIEIVELPERKKSVQEFIRTVKLTAETYEIDTRITEYDTHVSADFYFDFGGAMGWMKEVMAFADDVLFFHPKEGFEIIMTIEHYTHAVYRKGKKILPEEWDLNFETGGTYLQ